MECEHFGDLVDHFIHQSSRGPDQIQNLSDVSKATVVTWRNGGTKRPRNRVDIILIAAAMNLTKDETNCLLRSAKHKTLDEQPVEDLLASESLSQKRRQLLERWQKFFTGSSLPIITPPFQAPANLINFIDRIELKAQIKENLQKTPQICIVHGMGGTGKTTLAKDIAYELRSSFKDGVLWASLESIPDNPEQRTQYLLSIIGNFTAAFGRDVNQENNLNNRSAIFRDVLAEKQVLIVLDNAKTMAEVEPLLPAMPGNCAVIVTTRNRAILGSIGVSVTVPPFNGSESLAMLEHYLKSRVHDEALGAQRIIDFLGGHPLALTIVASDIAKLKEITLLEYYDLLVEEKNQLEILDISSFDTTLNVRACFELSYKQISKELKELFQTVSLFAGIDFGLNATLAALSLETSNPLDRIEVRRNLEALYFRSLLEYSPQDSNAEIIRYRFHPLLKLFAKEKIDNAAQKETTIQNIKNYFLGFVQSNRTTFHEVDIEWQNIVPIIQELLGQGEFRLLSEFLNALTEPNRGVVGYLDSRGYWELTLNLLEAVLEQSSLELDELQNASFLFKKGVFNFRLNGYQDALRYFEASQEVLNELPQSEDNAILNALCAEFASQCLFRSNNDIESAVTYLHEAIAELDQFGSSKAKVAQGHLHVVSAKVMSEKLMMLEEAILAAKLGVDIVTKHSDGSYPLGINALTALYVLQGDIQNSRKYLPQVMEEATAEGDIRLLANALMNMGILEQKEGRLENAIENHLKAMQFVEQIGDKRLKADLFLNLGLVEIVKSDDSAALDYFYEGLNLTKEYQLENEQAYILSTMVESLIREAHIDEAAKCLETAHSLCVKLELGPLIPSVYYGRAELQLYLGDLEEADRQIQKAISLAHEGNYLQEKGVALMIYGRVLEKKKQNQLARRAYQESLEILEAKDLYQKTKCQLAYGAFLLKESDEQSKELLANALKNAQSLNARSEIQTIQRLLK